VWQRFNTPCTYDYAKNTLHFFGIIVCQLTSPSHCNPVIGVRN
jgi:hypothetical protein